MPNNEKDDLKGEEASPSAAGGSMPEFDQADALRIAEQCFWNHYCGGTEGANAVINATQNAIWMAYKLGKDRA